MRKFTNLNRSEDSFTKLDNASDGEPFPLDLEKVAHEQEKYKVLQSIRLRDRNYLKEVIQDLSLINFKGKIYIPYCLTNATLNWYYHYYLEYSRSIQITYLFLI